MQIKTLLALRVIDWPNCLCAWDSFWSILQLKMAFVTSELLYAFSLQAKRAAKRAFGATGSFFTGAPDRTGWWTRGRYERQSVQGSKKA